MKVTNINYRNMIEKGIIKILMIEDIKKALDNITGKHRLMGRAFIILYYYTGARPIELFKLKGRDIKREGNKLLINIPGAKKGLPRTITLFYNRPLIAEFYNYVLGCMPEMFLFYGFKGERKTIIKGKEYIDSTYKLRYYFNKWFENVIEGGIPPYYLRHNRFSKSIMEGATPEQIKYLKGAKTMKSVEPYIHLSIQESKKLSKFLK